MPISTDGRLVRTDMRPDAIVDWIANAPDLRAVLAERLARGRAASGG